MPSRTELVAALGEMLCEAPVPGMETVGGITTDTRTLGKGDVFVALSGTQQRGDVYAEQALSKGAAFVVSEQLRPERVSPERWMQVAHANRAASILANVFYPEQPECVVAVTGTDGKTSTADFTRQFWAKQGLKAVSLGTLGIGGAGMEEAFPALNTTPYPVQLHRTLQALCESHVSHLCMEASSHGLDQRRLDSVRLKAAAFTTLGRDHLDYHANEETYFKAKQRLFAKLLPEGATSVLNADSRSYDALSAIAAQRKQQVLSYGSKGTHYRIDRISPVINGQALSLNIDGKKIEVTLPLIGAFQAMNVLAALGLATAGGIPVERLIPEIESLEGVPGRLQHVATHPNGAPVYIDYAHTPAALENILQTLRTHVSGKLHLVFGCGGDRDTGKRAPMGAAAAAYADRVIVTDDNPRHENAESIRAMVMEGCPSALNIGDRKKAIETALEALRPGDLLLIAGKGHEKTQTTGSEIFPFDDADVARNAVTAHDKRAQA